MIVLDLGALAAPGWTALALVVVLGLFVAFLYFSMRKQMSRITVPVDQAHPDAAPFADEPTTPRRRARTPGRDLRTPR